MKNIFTLITCFSIILFTLVLAIVGHTNPELPLTDHILRSKAAFAIVDEKIAHHLNLGVLSERDYQKLRGPVLWKIRAPIHFHLRKAFGRIVDSADFGGSTDSFSQSQTPPMKPILHKRAAEIIRDFINQEHISLIIRSDAPIGIGEVATIRGLRGEVRYTYDSINGACVFVPIRNLTALIKRPFVTEVWLDSKGDLALISSVPHIGADKIHNPPTGFGITGKGIRVAVVDGGIDSNHPELRGRVVDTRGVLGRGGSNKNKDDIDHGTHVAGIIAANGPMLTGVAPDVELLDAQADWKQDSFIFGNSVFFQLNQDNYSDTMDAIRWASEKNRILNSSEKADIINLSAGWDVWEYRRDGSDPMSQLIDEVVDSGIVFVVAAGNEAMRRATGDIISNLDPINTEEHKFKVGRLGIVKVTLLWDKAAHDLDLSVLEHPSGKMLYNSRTHTSVFNNSLSEQIVFTEKTGDVCYTLQVEAPLGRVQDSQNYEVWVSKGSKFELPDSAKTVNVPAYSQKAITVGAVDHNNAATSFSSQGPSSPVAINPGLVLKPSLIKPEIVAPGENIKSTISAGHYDSYPGTSMAAPHVAGVAALILDAVGKDSHGEWNFSPDEVKSAIVRGAEGLTNVPDNTYGAGLVRADNIIFCNTVAANQKKSFKILPRLTAERYASGTLNADPTLKVAISWENPTHNLDLVLLDANGRKVLESNQVSSNYEKIGPPPNQEATYFLEVHNRSGVRVSFTGAATHKVIEAPIIAQKHPPDLPTGPAETVYWTDWETNKIQRASVKGTNVEDLVSTGLISPYSIVLDVDGDKMYWTDAGTAKIQRANLDGTNVEDLIPLELSAPICIALDVTGDKMYWTDRGTSKIQCANLDGSNVEDLVSGVRGLHGIALDVAGGKMYWTDNEVSQIQRANLDGTRVENLITTRLQLPNEIALDVVGGKMYWTDDGTRKIQRANLDGSNVEDLITTGLHLPVGITLDITGRKLYWTDIGTKKIQCANLDGSNVQDLITTGLKAPFGITLGPSSTLAPPVVAREDVNGDGVVDLLDLVLVTQNNLDINGDGVSDIVDRLLIIEAMVNAAGAPAAQGEMQKLFTPEKIQKWLNEATLLGEDSHVYGKAILLLKQLLARLTPQETALLPNYPNPLNPETWIPYQIAEPTDVTLYIYAANGHLVRTLMLGHQQAGIYQSQSRAAYWDGRNDLGEPVASGIYFYTLSAGKFMATRKMLIRK